MPLCKREMAAEDEARELASCLVEGCNGNEAATWRGLGCADLYLQ